MVRVVGPIPDPPAKPWSSEAFCYPSPELYRHLYARYFNDEKTRRLIARAGNLEGQRVADLCCGTGVVGLATVVHKPKFVLFVDQEEEMIDWVRQYARCQKKEEQNIFVEQKSMAGFLSAPPRGFEQFDVVFCQQAVNYWLDVPIGIPSVALKFPTMAAALANIVVPGGKFIFNTFAAKPPETPLVKEYDFNKFHYVETTWSIGNRIHHVQVVNDLPPHATVFRWLSWQVIVDLLSPYFQIKCDPDGASLYFTCVRH